ncbi:MAG: hypothetical protein JXR37_21035 [Kiritimatiellae bacterium]|nr:hypothetical protein [Kiritimatiellia bacterium]
MLVAGGGQAGALEALAGVLTQRFMNGGTAAAHAAAQTAATRGVRKPAPVHAAGGPADDDAPDVLKQIPGKPEPKPGT